jgi:methyl-accepting chemotaxis protein
MKILVSGKIIPFTTMSIIKKFLIIGLFTLTGLEFFLIRLFNPDISTLDITLLIYMIIFSTFPFMAIYVFYKTTEPKFEKITSDMNIMALKNDFDTNTVFITSHDNLGNISQSYYAIANFFTSIIQSSQAMAQSLSESAVELASTTEEVNALSEEIAASVQQISRGATNQSELSSGAINDVVKMSEVVEYSVKDIENTLLVIEDIAGQTNILALNAAIEAARAGEYGRGFAVVSDNVRRLTEETKNNASDINSLTEKIVSDIGGSIITLQESLQGFAAQSEEFSASSEEVATATEEQTAAMHQMTSMAQHLTKLSEELTIVTKKLDE